jgi:hypothetical protein
MMNIDPMTCIPGPLTEVVSKHEAQVGFVVNDRQMSITIHQTDTGRLLWRIEVLVRLTALTWHISEYTDVAELRHQGIATEFCERLIQQAEDSGIKCITAHCSPESAAFFIQRFGAVRAGNIPSEQRVQVFGRAGLDDGSVGWNLDASLAIFVRCHQRELSAR